MVLTDQYLRSGYEGNNSIIYSRKINELKDGAGLVVDKRETVLFSKKKKKRKGNSIVDLNKIKLI